HAIFEAARFHSAGYSLRPSQTNHHEVGAKLRHLLESVIYGDVGLSAQQNADLPFALMGDKLADEFGDPGGLARPGRPLHNDEVPGPKGDLDRLLLGLVQMCLDERRLL